MASPESLPSADALDPAAVRRLVSTASRASAANALSRAKNASNLALAAPSEAALHDAIAALGPLPTRPDLFPPALSAGLLPTLVDLLAHDNLDIIHPVLSLLADFTDPSGEDDAAPHIDFCTRLIDNGGVAAAVAVFQTLARHPQPDDRETVAAAAAAAIAVVENAAALCPHLSPTLARDCGVAKLCVDEIRGGDDAYSERRVAATEVAALLLQAEAANRATFTAVGGVAAVLDALAPYQRCADARDMHGDEVEMVSNMFGVLCAALLECGEAKRAFCDGEGVELMLLFARKRPAFREHALKTLDFACTRFAPSARRAFAAGGVGVVFAVFMTLWASTDGAVEKLSGGKRRKRRMRSAPSEAQRSEAEHLVSVLFSLFRFANESECRRLAAKFSESGGAKLRRLLVIYADRLDDVSSARESANFGGSERYASEMVAVVLAHVCVTGGRVVSEAVADSLQSLGGMKTLRSLVRSFGDGVDEGLDGDERKRLALLADRLVVGGVEKTKSLDLSKGPS